MYIHMGLSEKSGVQAWWRIFSFPMSQFYVINAGGSHGGPIRVPGPAPGRWSMGQRIAGTLGLRSQPWYCTKRLRKWTKEQTKVEKQWESFEPKNTMVVWSALDMASLIQLDQLGINSCCLFFPQCKGNLHRFYHQIPKKFKRLFRPSGPQLRVRSMLLPWQK